MQKNDMTLKRRIKVDGEEWRGLVETSELIDQEGTVEIPGFSRKVDMKDGVKKMEPLDLIYKVNKDKEVRKKFYDWYNGDENHDVTVINTDGTGQEVNKWLLRDCECTRYSERTYNAAGIEFFGISVQIICTTKPVRKEE